MVAVPYRTGGRGDPWAQLVREQLIDVMVAGGGQWHHCPAGVGRIVFGAHHLVLGQAEVLPRDRSHPTQGQSIGVEQREGAERFYIDPSQDSAAALKETYSE